MSLRLELGEGRRVRGMGAPSEELRINIADEMGTRAYETFSGGEAFRINFALRIALSRLLARRSGAPLPVLFIDEGFGSQDAAGQQRLVEAIQSIRSDFDKIIVITHIDAIKGSVRYADPGREDRDGVEVRGGVGVRGYCQYPGANLSHSCTLRGSCSRLQFLRESTFPMRREVGVNARPPSP